MEKALECFKRVTNPINIALSESDTRTKIIDPVFKCLGWEEEDITREECSGLGFVDYVFRRGKTPLLVVEAKKFGSSFLLPKAFTKRRYRINGAISSDNTIREAIDRAQRYSIETGTKYAAVTNGHQYVIFESFRYGGNWREGFCIIFTSFEDMIGNFALFWNILSKEAVCSGSLTRYLSEETVPSAGFKRPLDLIHNPQAICKRNTLSQSLTPLISYIFQDLTSDSHLDVLKKCYVNQEQMNDTDTVTKIGFDGTPYDSKKPNISWAEQTAASFASHFERYSKEAPGSVIMLLGGTGCGKTTFLHHFFKVNMADRKDVLWFYVDFKGSPTDPEHIEAFILNSVVADYDARYRKDLEEQLDNIGPQSVKPTLENLVSLFAALRLKGYTTSIVLDNVDQHTYVTPSYPERVFLLAQSISYSLKTVALLTLREESYFRSTRSGVLDAYYVPKFHIAPPDFEVLIRSRINYALDFLRRDNAKIKDIIGFPIRDKETLTLFFDIINYSIRQSRRVGRDILRFIDQVSGQNRRQALDFMNEFMISGNTDIDEIIKIEYALSSNGTHYQIPLHQFVKSIMLQDSIYFSSVQSSFFNLFDVNPQYTDSHFLHLRIINYLEKWKNYFATLEKGFVKINQILDEAESVGINQKAVEDSVKKLAAYGLIEFDNQSRIGYDTAVYARVTVTGQYYLERLAYMFAYVDLVFQDTPICEEETLESLRKSLVISPQTDKIERLQIRFCRVQRFLKYLAEMETAEFAKNPEYESSEFTRARFMRQFMENCLKEIEYINSKL
jgi:energy-coupling factor transporter ATP-binding protein EcfA2